MNNCKEFFPQIPQIGPDIFVTLAPICNRCHSILADYRSASIDGSYLPAVYFFTIDVTAYIKKSPLLLKEGWPSDVRRMAGVVD
jgi:hypothetical protein